MTQRPDEQGRQERSSKLAKSPTKPAPQQGGSQSGQTQQQGSTTSQGQQQSQTTIRDWAAF
jgi:hypothetical protein